MAHLADRVDPGEDPTSALAKLEIADLYLACAAARGLPAAIASFEQQLLARVGQFIGRVDRSPHFVAEVTQALRIKLFVRRDGGESRLAQYSGRGALDSWVCAAALRTAYDLRRSEHRQTPHEWQDPDVLAASDDPELALLRERHGDEFRRAVGAAIAALDARSRTLLRLHFLEQLTHAQIGKMYRVHETTALRWIAHAREAVVAHVHTAIERTLQLSASECDEPWGFCAAGWTSRCAASSTAPRRPDERSAGSRAAVVSPVTARWRNSLTGDGSCPGARRVLKCRAAPRAGPRTGWGGASMKKRSSPSPRAARRRSCSNVSRRTSTSARAASSGWRA